MLVHGVVDASQSGLGLRLNGSTDVTMGGNVVLGGAQGAPGTAFTVGNGMSDFENLAFDASALDATPTDGGAIAGAGELAYWTLFDLMGEARTPPVDPGCRDAD